MVDHHYSRMDLATLVGGLDRAGVSLIEVGHGNGVGSQFFKDPKLRATSLPLVDDEGQAKVALRVAQHAQVGVVLTAGKRFVPVDYIDRIADLGYAFIRLTCMPDETDDDLMGYVRRIKDRGMLASINMMQTYAKSPAHVAEVAARAAGHGVDWFYIVDSAGGMTADEVKRYVTAILGAAKVEVGLHAHNNLGSAVANGLAAVEAGATLVDGTLNGMGRATGNPATEQLAVALRSRGLAQDIDLDALVVLGNAIRSLFDGAGNNPLDFVSGAGLVHSRNVPKILEAARNRDRSACEFLLAAGAEARRSESLTALTFSDEVYEVARAASKPAHRMEPSDAMIEVVTEEILGRWSGGPRRAIEDLSLRSRQRHVESVVHVSRAATALCAHPVPWQSSVMGVTIPYDQASSWEVEPDRLPDFVLVDDGDPEPLLRANIATWRLSFTDLYARAVQDLCQSLRHLGVTLWCPERGAARDADRLLGAVPRLSGPRPAGAIAMLLGEDASRDVDLGSGDIGVFVIAPVRVRVEAARKRGARIVQPKWPTAVAQAAESLIALHRELASADSTDGLASGARTSGVGQATWDPERAMLLDADDPVAAARRASSAYFSSIIGGTRRL